MGPGLLAHYTMGRWPSPHRPGPGGLPVSGDYNLYILLDGVQILHGPWPINVRHDEPSVNATMVFGSGTIDARAGHSARFTVQARDRHNNNGHRIDNEKLHDSDGNIRKYYYQRHIDNN